MIQTQAKCRINYNVWSSVGDKLFGPNGYNMTFFKSSWEVIGSNVCLAIQEFHHNAKLPKAFTSSLIALIPKVDSPQSLSNF